MSDSVKLTNNVALGMSIPQSSTTQERLSDDFAISPMPCIYDEMYLNVSEDEETDSDWDSPCQSPCQSNEFIFEFNSGLSIETLISQTSVEPMSKELRDLNVKWNKAYSPTLSNKTSKVHFAEELTTIHYVGNEDRAGEWYRLALDRMRFQRRIEETETILASILMMHTTPPPLIS